MPFDLILRNGQIASAEGIASADIAIDNGKIAAVGSLEDSAAEELDVSGLTVFPGAIDTQVHFRQPGFEHKETIRTGTQSAALGGVTTVLEMPNTNPPTTGEAELEEKVRIAREGIWCNIGFFIGASPENVDELARLELLPGTPGIKIFMGSSTGSLLVPDDATLWRVLMAGKKRVPVHAEDHYRLEERKALISANPTPAEHPVLRDAEAARLATERLLRLSSETGRAVHVLHVSTLEELPLIGEAKSRKVKVTAEVTPQHLWFSSPECYDRLGTKAQMNPPIRSVEHRSALRRALQDGLFDVIGSDHAPHTLEEKGLPYPKSPSGMPGVQTLLSVMLTLALDEHLISLPELVTLTSRSPARLYGIRNKGEIRAGYDADIAVVDLNRRFEVEPAWIASKCGWSPYEGMTLRGFPVHTIVNGRFSVREGELEAEGPGDIPAFST